MELSNGALTHDGETLLSGLPDTASLLPDRLGIGAFISFTTATPAAFWETKAGIIPNVARWTACHRYEPFWMVPKAGTNLGAVPPETQYLLCEGHDGSITLVVPLPDAVSHTRVQGDGDNGLTLTVETNDTQTASASVTGLFIARGPEPFALLEQSAQSVAARLQMGKLRVEKGTPDFIHQFGWCTWDAFYQDVSRDKVREGLESFGSIGIQPRYLILDDGWQSVTAPKDDGTKPKRLTGFAANSKFPGDLRPTVAMAKAEFGIKTFLVWHAMGGYWAGVDGSALPGYDIANVNRRYSESVIKEVPDLLKWFEPDCDVIPPHTVHRFYQDYHRHLRSQGVDGVKIDNQASLEGVSEGMGGRVNMMRTYHEALEGAASVHLNGNVINCMSCSSEMLYGTRASTLTRTSTDFWPNRPESHGLHLYTNAQVSAWFGHFVAPDWDMFQSGHAAGMYHAAGRAVGGCPVYVSDKPDAHNADVLRKLVLPDGSVLVADRPGMPTRDCLFHDPTKEDVLLKIHNVSGYGGLVGVFHARYGEGVDPISGVVRPSDVPDILGAEFADHFLIFAHHANELRFMEPDEAWKITLEPLTAEVFTIVPVPKETEGNTILPFTPVGIRDVFNTAGTIMGASAEVINGTKRGFIHPVCPGTLVVWTKAPVTAVTCQGAALPFSYDATSNRLDIDATQLVLPLITVHFE